MILGGIDLGAWGSILLVLAGLTYCVWYVVRLRRALAARRTSAVGRQPGQGRMPLDL